MPAAASAASAPASEPNCLSNAAEPLQPPDDANIFSDVPFLQPSDITTTQSFGRKFVVWTAVIVHSWCLHAVLPKSTASSI